MATFEDLTSVFRGSKLTSVLACEDARPPQQAFTAWRCSQIPPLSSWPSSRSRRC